MELTNDEIINLYQQNKFDTIITNLQLTPEWELCHEKDLRKIPLICKNTEYILLRSQFEQEHILRKLPDKYEFELTYDLDSQHILAYVTYIANIELFPYVLTSDSLCPYILINILRNPKLYSVLGHLLEQNTNLCEVFCNILNSECCWTISHDIVSQNNILLLKFILQHCANNKITLLIIEVAICANNLELLGILFNSGMDVKSVFDMFMNDIIFIDGEFTITLDSTRKGVVYRTYFTYTLAINFATIAWLVSHEIHITNHIDKISAIYINANDLLGIKYCVENGADVNYLLREIPEKVNLDIVKYLIDNGADVNKLEFENIIRIMKSTEIIILLIESGLDISEYKFKLVLRSISNCNDVLVTYLIKLYPDLIPMEDNLLLFYATYTGYLNIISILLDHGADIHANNDSISLFFDRKFTIFPGYRIVKYCGFFLVT
jgi:hypothetical protein